jgi:uncharacterized protein YabE (DUF348 family)
MNKTITNTLGGITMFITAQKRRLHPQVLKNHPFALPVATFLVLFFVSIIVFIGLNARGMGARDSRIVQVSVNGEHQILPTRADTVEKLLARMDIEINEEDIVEPEIKSAIDADNFQINVYKARPVNIVDNGNKVTTVTAEPTPERIAREIGRPVHPEDRVEKQTKVI